MLLESYDLIAVTESWWDDSGDWSATIGGYSERIDKEGGVEAWLFMSRSG